MYRLFLLVFLLCSCLDNVSEEEVRQAEYGELYATMSCWRHQPDEESLLLFWCNETLDTELIKGFVSLAVEEDTGGSLFLAICGHNVELNTGHDLHDNLIAALTMEQWNCHNAYERKLGNEFDWMWDDKLRNLQLIWRPEDATQKVLTVHLPPWNQDSTYVTGYVYYKSGYFD